MLTRDPNQSAGATSDMGDFTSQAHIDDQETPAAPSKLARWRGLHLNI